MDIPAIELIHLTRDFSIGLRNYKLRALQQVDLVIPSGQIFGLLGPNGSGKSTTIKIILGLIPPSDGQCQVFGKPAGSRESRARIGYLPENPVFYRFLSGRELVRFFASISGMSGDTLNTASESALDTVGMTEHADRRVRTYSKGMLQRIGLAQALVHDPDIIVLDEPMSGLDPVGTSEFISILHDLCARGKTILLASHLLARVEEVCDNIAILNKGQLVQSGTVDSIVEDNGISNLRVRGLNSPKEVALRQFLKDADLELLECKTGRRSLDDVFLDALHENKKVPPS